MLTAFNYFQAFLIGTCIGSFLNVVSYRFPNDLSIVKPRSFCPNCKKQLTWKENIPLLSWIIQKGKCKYCRKSIAFSYPFIEFLTGILFVIFINSSPSLYSLSSNLLFIIFFSWSFLSILICISLIDIYCFWIPQGLINFGFLLGTLGLVFIYMSSTELLDLSFIIKGLSNSLITYLIFEAFRYLAKFIFRKDAIGKGDSKLVAMFALWLGPMSTFFAVSISYVFAAIYCLIGLSFNFLRFRQVIPFGPFLSLGALFMWFFGNNFFIEKLLRIQ